MLTFFRNQSAPSIPWLRSCAWKGTIESRPAPMFSLLAVAAYGADLHQLRGNWRRSHGFRFAGLRIAPVVQDAHLLHAGNGAARRAEFLREIFVAAHFRRVLRQRNARISALLRTPVHQAVLANIEIARAGAAAPVVFAAARVIVLEFVEARKRALPQRHHLFENFRFARPQRL